MVPVAANEMSAPPQVPENTTGRWLAAGLQTAIRRSKPMASLTAGPGAPAMALTVLLFVALHVLLSRAEIAGEAQFSWSAWLWGWAGTCLSIGAAWFALAIARPGGHRPSLPSSGWLLLYWVGALVPTAVYGLWRLALAHGWIQEVFITEWVHWGLYAGVLLWLLLIAWRSGRMLGASPWRAAGVALVVVAMDVATSWYLQAPLWQPVQAQTAEAPRPPLRLSQDVFEDQQALLAQALEEVKPRADGPSQVFAVVYAPYEEGVFLREAEMVTQSMADHLGAQDRTVTLLNHSSTVALRPWATPRNLRAAIATLAQRMDPERDLLVLYLTSHGGSDHKLASRLWPLDVPALQAQEVKAWLDEHRIRHRAVIVSACYSGGWVPPLADDTSLVMTASAADRVAYGCGEDSPLTYFGEALFRHALPQTRSLEQAYALAVPHIAALEKAAGLGDTPSLPQLHVGEGFRARWSGWMQTVGRAR